MASMIVRAKIPTSFRQPSLTRLFFPRRSFRIDSPPIDDPSLSLASHFVQSDVRKHTQCRLEPIWDGVDRVEVEASFVFLTIRRGTAVPRSFRLGECGSIDRIDSFLLL